MLDFLRQSLDNRQLFWLVRRVLWWILTTWRSWRALIIALTLFRWRTHAATAAQFWLLLKVRFSLSYYAKFRLHFALATLGCCLVSLNRNVVKLANSHELFFIRIAFFLLKFLHQLSKHVLLYLTLTFFIILKVFGSNSSFLNLCCQRFEV